MRIVDDSFRNIDQKWIAIEKSKDINKLNKQFKLELDDNLILAYLYIDHNNGLAARLIGNIYNEDNTLSIDDKFLTEDIIIYSDILKKIKFDIVEDNTKNAILNTDVIENDVKIKYYNKPSIIESRSLNDIDEFRHDFFPDDLELYFERNKKSELIWGRIEVYSKEKGILACKLLNDSKIDENYKKDAYVFVKIIKDKNDIDVVIDALANIKK